MADDIRRQYKAQISRIVKVTHTWGIEDDAIENLIARKPAFWSMCGNHNQFDGQLFAACNRLGSIDAAQEEYAGIFSRRGMDVTDETRLDYLLPLNNEAVMMLMRAYQGIGTWRTPEELEARTERTKQGVSLRQFTKASSDQFERAEVLQAAE